MSEFLEEKVVDETSAVPLYHQVFLLIKKAIVDGELASNDILPGEIDLAELFGVSRITIKKALDGLAQEGFVSRHRGRGTIVEYTKPETAITMAYRSVTRDLSVRSEGLNIETLESKVIPASNFLADKLGIEAGTYISRTIRRRLRDKTPVDLSVNSYIEEAASYLDVKGNHMRPMNLELKGTKFEVCTISQDLISVLADRFASGCLEIEMGSPLTKLNTRGFDAQNSPVHYTEIYLRPDLIRLNISLTC